MKFDLQITDCNEESYFCKYIKWITFSIIFSLSIIEIKNPTLNMYKIKLIIIIKKKEILTKQACLSRMGNLNQSDAETMDWSIR